uniref:Vacuolar fusion protein MON1 homolog n=1 Tax=Lactuca sativa TaxID=4236 RepID=A0A9R1WN06_LACSA|nr:hypothetical protein LSAT_V11C100025940 [Lactuca sativa]
MVVDTNETKKIVPIAHSTPKFHLTPTTPKVKSGVNKLSNTFSKKKIIFVVSLYFLKGGNAFSCWKQNSKTSESFSPICLPRYNAMPFLHAYVHYFDVSEEKL